MIYLIFCPRTRKYIAKSGRPTGALRYAQTFTTHREAELELCTGEIVLPMTEEQFRLATLARGVK